MKIEKVFMGGIVVGSVVGGLIGIAVGGYCMTSSFLVKDGIPSNPSYIMYQDKCPLCEKLRESDYSYSIKEGTHTCNNCKYTIDFK